MKKVQNTPKPKDCVGKKPKTVKPEKKLTYPQQLREKIKNLEAEVKKKNEDIGEWKAEYISIERSSKELEKQLVSLQALNESVLKRLDSAHDIMFDVMLKFREKWFKSDFEKRIIKDIQHRLYEHPIHPKQVD